MVVAQICITQIRASDTGQATYCISAGILLQYAYICMEGQDGESI